MEYYSTLEQVKGYLERRISLRPDQATDAGAPQGAAAYSDIWEEEWDAGRKKVLLHTSDSAALLPFPAEGKNVPAILVIPGGGYVREVINLEGTDVALWLNSLGISAYVLIYRLPSGEAEGDTDFPLTDARRAMRLLRANAEKWDLDQNRIGTMGFSAGGHLASVLATIPDHDQSAAGERDEIDGLSARPDFLSLLYPAISKEAAAPQKEAASPEHFLLPYEPLLLKKIMETQDSAAMVTPCAPISFLTESDDDQLTCPENSLRFYSALRACGIPAELHIMQTGNHGFGLGETRTQSGSWKLLFVNWLKTNRFL